jgi:hypothetical protein
MDGPPAWRATRRTNAPMVEPQAAQLGYVTADPGQLHSAASLRPAGWRSSPANTATKRPPPYKVAPISGETRVIPSEHPAYMRDSGQTEQ